MHVCSAKYACFAEYTPMNVDRHQITVIIIITRRGFSIVIKALELRHTYLDPNLLIHEPSVQFKVLDLIIVYL